MKPFTEFIMDLMIAANTLALIYSLFTAFTKSFILGGVIFFISSIVTEFIYNLAKYYEEV